MVGSRRRKVEAQAKRDAETLAGLDGIERLCERLKKQLGGRGTKRGAP